MFSDFSFTSFLVFDALVVGGVAVGFALFMYTFGKHAFVPAVAALGMGAVFAALAVYVGHIPGLSTWPEYHQQIAMFVVASVVAFGVFRRNSFFEPSTIPTGAELAIAAVMMTGFTLAVLGSFLPADVVATLSPNVRVVFVDALPRTLWLLSPVAVLAGMRG